MGEVIAAEQDQLFGQFQRCHEIVRQTPIQAESVKHLRELLNVASGGVVFTTMQKFAPDEAAGKAPLLSNRRNILVIADEAHRSQYDLIDGLARNLRDSLPNASFVGFTGTPLTTGDKVSSHADDEFPSASVMKLPILG